MDIYEYGNRPAQTVLLQPVDARDLGSVEKEISFIRENADRDFLLTVFAVNDWNRELSPWEAPAVFGREDFDGCAHDTLNEILSYCTDKTRTYYIGGYSLAGLFALWAAFKTDIFRGVAAVSPSVWFPGFDDFINEHEIKCKNVYLSLGNKEEKTRNPVMSTVGDKIRTINALLDKQGVNCVLEWNAGNHFQNPDKRTASGFSWLLNFAKDSADT